jgi:hypothetical protein
MTEVNPPPLQPKALDMPKIVPAPSQQKPQLRQELLRLLFHQWLKRYPLKLNKTLPQFRKSGMR